MPMKNNANIKSSEALDLLRSEDHEMLKEFYVVMYPKVLDFILQNVGTACDARDVFQDSLVLFLHKIQQETFQGVDNIKWGQYFLGIVHKLWLRELKTRRKQSFVDISEMPEMLELDQLELDIALSTNEWRRELVHKALHQLPPDCRDLLMMYYIDCVDAKDIAEKMGYTESFVRLKKLRSLHKLKKLILQYSHDLLNH
jgi:RNA polymerase sigma factor (sigma-70 family)